MPIVALAMFSELFMGCGAQLPRGLLASLAKRLRESIQSNAGATNPT